MHNESCGDIQLVSCYLRFSGSLCLPDKYISVRLEAVVKSIMNFDQLQQSSKIEDENELV